PSRTPEAPAHSTAGPSAPAPTPTPAPDPGAEPAVDLQTKGGYLLIGDRIMHSFTTDAQSLQSYADMLRQSASQMPQARVFSMVVPNSFPFYAPRSFLTPENDQRDMIRQLYAMLDPSVVPVYTYDILEAHRDEYLYFRADHHWTARGAYWAYTGFCAALGVEPVGLDRFERGQYEGFLGSFYRDLSKYPQSDAVQKNPDTVEYFLPPAACSAEVFATPEMTEGAQIPVVNTQLSDDVTNKYMCFTNGDQPLIRIRTQADTGRTLLVVKESYGNALIPFFTSHFDEIYVVDFRRFNRGGDTPPLKLPAFAKTHGVTDVLFVNYPEVPNSGHFVGMIEKLTD
ncbi:MAG: hypothetical protein LBC26_02480, partial [Oscillospiraceae bacterium]|nr:hypothetical protein [Oscillospiraceae bacterium]